MKFFPYCGITHTEESIVGMRMERLMKTIQVSCQSIWADVIIIFDCTASGGSAIKDNYHICFHQIFLGQSPFQKVFFDTKLQCTFNCTKSRWLGNDFEGVFFASRRWWWRDEKIFSYKFRGQRKVGDTLNWTRQPADCHTGGRNVGTDLNSF